MSLHIFEHEKSCVFSASRGQLTFHLFVFKSCSACIKLNFTLALKKIFYQIDRRVKIAKPRESKPQQCRARGMYRFTRYLHNKTLIKGSINSGCRAHVMIGCGNTYCNFLCTDLGFICTVVSFEVFLKIYQAVRYDFFQT